MCSARSSVTRHAVVFWFALLTALPLSARALEVQKVADGVYALVGEMGARTPKNLGNNATFGAVVTSAGVVLIDSGAGTQAAKALEAALRKVTDRPVVMVINTGGQDHRWLGNGYFQSRGAKIVAAKAAVADQQARATDQFNALARAVGEEKMAGTEPVYATETFDDRRELTVGGVRFLLHHAGAAHTPGDTYVWLPQRKVVFTGDIVYTERLLAVIPVSNSKSWIASFDAMASLKPKHVVPGHGHATDLAQARRHTRDYLVMLRNGVSKLLERGEGLEQVSTIDQSAFAKLLVYEDLKGRNAHQVYQEIEFE